MRVFLLVLLVSALLYGACSNDDNTAQKDAGTRTESDTDVDTDRETYSDSDADTDSDTDIDTDGDADADADGVADTNTEVAPDTAPGSDTGTPENEDTGVDTSADPSATPAWRSGFEGGFPGEFLDYDSGSWSSGGTVNPGRSECWTIVDGDDFSDIFAGDHVYKGWIVASQDDSHRAYPVIHCDIPSPLVNSFMVWLDIDYAQLSEWEWVHFATWANNEDWDVHTMSVRDRKVEMAHLDWRYIGPEPQPDFPLKRWVRFTAYIDYHQDGYIRVWQDGVPVLEGNYTTRAGQNLMRAHWGMYASGAIDHGVQYNDEIQIWTLSAPLTDLENEPVSPY